MFSEQSDDVCAVRFDNDACFILYLRAKTRTSRSTKIGKIFEIPNRMIFSERTTKIIFGILRRVRACGTDPGDGSAAIFSAPPPRSRSEQNV